jgi:hypothetical protein
MGLLKSFKQVKYAFLPAILYTLLICSADSFFINVMKVNFSPSQIITIFKLTEPELMRVHCRSLIFTKYLPPAWSLLLTFQHLLPVYLMYKHMFALLQFSLKRLLTTFKISRKSLTVSLLSCETFLTV